MYISEKHMVKSKSNTDGTVTYMLYEKIGEGRYKQIDSITTKHAESAYIRFEKITNQLT